MEESSSNNRYSRLNAMKSYGFDFDWSILRNKHVFIAGVGGIGSFSAELLARVGIGKLSILDYDIVEQENLNRVFYNESHVGQYKVMVAKTKLENINPDSIVTAYRENLMNEAFELTLDTILDTVDIVLMGLDNIPARQFLNYKIVKNNKPMVDCGVLRSGLGGYVHLIVPKKTACYACTGSVNFKTNDASGPDCSASMPTTTSILSALQVQTAIKYLLNTGRIPDFIQYNALGEKMLEFKLQVDENCYICGKGKKENVIDEKMIELPPLSKIISEIEKFKQKD